MSDRFGMPLIVDTPEMKARVDQARQRRDIENRFTYHPPRGDQAERYGEIRRLALDMETALAERCPESRELSTALTKLDEMVFFANAAIARNE